MGSGPGVLQAAFSDLSTAFLGIPKTMAYGLVRGAGNLILQQELTDKTRICFYMLGEGPWDSLLRLWINRLPVNVADSSIVHFHPGGDGEIGNGLSAVSTGGDQHIDQFFTLLPGGLDPCTFSRYAWLALKVAPDPGAPSATLEVLADYQAMQVRIFDSSGNQTAFQWTQNWAWIICDYLIRKFVLREAKVNQPLVAAEMARFDWASFTAAATYYDAVLSLGQKRFSDGGIFRVNDTNTAGNVLDQMLLMCRSYLLERNGKFTLYPDQARSSIFTFTSDNVQPKSFKAYKSNLRAAKNRLTPTFRDLNLASGSSDNATRFAIADDPQLNHEAHQRTTGVRGPGLSVIPKITEELIDLGVNTPERVWRILKSKLVRHLGDDVDANSVYDAPFTAEWTGFEDSLAVESGDVVLIDRSLSEEFGGTSFEVMEIDEKPDGTRDFIALEYMPNAFPEVAPVQQTLQAPVPGTGPVPIATGVDSGGNLIVGRSTAFNTQGNFPASSMTSGILAAKMNSVGGVGDPLSVIKFTWSAQSFPRGDASTLALAASTALAVPAAPTLSSVAGGSLGARTRFVRVALIKNGNMYGISNESSLAISANNLLKVTSPAAIAGYDGWIPLSSDTIPSSTNEQILDQAPPSSPIAFGTDFTEPTTGLTAPTASSTWADDNLASSAQGLRFWKLEKSITYLFYIALDIPTGLVRSFGGALLASDPVLAAKQSGDGVLALSGGSISLTTPASGTGTGSAGSAGGGRGIL